MKGTSFYLKSFCPFHIRVASNALSLCELNDYEFVMAMDLLANPRVGCKKVKAVSEGGYKELFVSGHGADLLPRVGLTLIKGFDSRVENEK